MSEKCFCHVVDKITGEKYAVKDATARQYIDELSEATSNLYDKISDMDGIDAEALKNKIDRQPITDPNVKDTHYVYGENSEEPEHTFIFGVEDKFADPYTIARRDANGNIIINEIPTAPNHAISKKFLEEYAVANSNGVNIVYGTNSHGEKNNRTVSREAKHNTIAIRTDNGTLKTANPIESDDATPKSYVDNALANAGGAGGSVKLYRHNVYITITDESEMYGDFNINIINSNANQFESIEQLITYLPVNVPFIFSGESSTMYMVYRVGWVRTGNGDRLRLFSYQLMNPGFTETIDLFEGKGTMGGSVAIYVSDNITEV